MKEISISKVYPGDLVYLAPGMSVCTTMNGSPYFRQIGWIFIDRHVTPIDVYENSKLRWHDPIFPCLVLGHYVHDMAKGLRYSYPNEGVVLLVNCAWSFDYRIVTYFAKTIICPIDE
jgi:hypothetical protein